MSTPAASSQPDAPPPAPRFAGQVALVTGGAGALGLGIAWRLAAEGARIALLDRDEAALLQAGSAFVRAGHAAHVLIGDVTEDATVETAVNEVWKQHGRIDVLVTAHGINGNAQARTHELPPADFDRVLAINLRGAFLCIRAVLPAMQAAGYGRIVNIASIAGKEGNARMLPYSTAKAGLIGLTKVLGKELAGTGITCNAVAPALVRTPATETAHTADAFAALTARIPMARTGEIAEVAAVVAYAASRECSFTTGFVFDASGGRTVY